MAYSDKSDFGKKLYKSFQVNFLIRKSSISPILPSISGKDLHTNPYDQEPPFL